MRAAGAVRIDGFVWRRDLRTVGDRRIGHRIPQMAHRAVVGRRGNRRFEVFDGVRENQDRTTGAVGIGDCRLFERRQYHGDNQ